MAEFSGKIVDAVYVNEEYSIVKIRYEDSAGNLAVYNLEANPDDEDYKALVAEGWDSEKILDSTAEFKKAQAAAFSIEVNTAAKLMVDEILAGEKEIIAGKKEALANDEKALADLKRNTRTAVQDMLTEAWIYIVDNNTDKDMLFKFKLWVLEQEFVKEIPKEQKSAIRKATRVTQLFSIIDDLIK